MTAKPKINPAMQPNIRCEFRKWQQTPHGDYGYGECPYCGEIGSCEFEGYSSEHDFQLESWHCDNCDIDWELERDMVYRFYGVLPEEQR